MEKQKVYIVMSEDVTDCESCATVEIEAGAFKTFDEAMNKCKELANKWLEEEREFQSAFDIEDDEHNGVEVYDCGSGAFKHYAVAVYNGLQSYHYYAVELTVN